MSCLLYFTYCQCRPSVGVSWTYEITIDDYTVNFTLKNYIHVVKKMFLKCVSKQAEVNDSFPWQRATW